MKKERAMHDKTDAATEPEPAAPNPGLTSESQDLLGAKLRSAYGDLVREPLPDKFKALLEELAKSEKKQ